IQPPKSPLRRFVSQIAYFTYFVTLIQVLVFIVELVRMSQLTGSPLQTKPSFNPMIGPLSYVQINMGSRFTPCMHTYKGLTDDPSLLFPCPNSTTTDTEVCSLRELCGMNGFGTYTNASGDTVSYPNQWYRVFVPMFLHAGFLHICFNLFLQLTMGADIERTLGIVRYMVIYIALGMSGFLLGANFSTNGISSSGASGALFGIIAVNLLMFVYAGKEGRNHYNTTHYKLFLITMVCEIVISLFLGLLPGLDNFSHVGGAVQGLLLGVVLLKDPHFVYDSEYLASSRYDIRHPLKNKRTKFFGTTFSMRPNLEAKVKSRLIYWLIFRVVCFLLSLAYFTALAMNFHKNGGGGCSWCKYLNCIPVNGWCDIG
ncbi:hypothetical protein BABINDRAFT_19043, partial [Babjeviella inositovora NRRL Y-12698]